MTARSVPKRGRPPLYGARQEDLPRSRGAVLLAQTGLTSGEIAAAVGVTDAMVRHWRQGVKVPPIDKRRTLAREYGVPTEAWEDSARILSPVADPGGTPRARRTDEDYARIADRIIDAVVITTERFHEAETPQQLMRLARDAVQSLEKAARIEGVRFDLTEAQIVRTPAFHRLRERIHALVFEALRPFPPDVADRVGEALRELDNL